MRVLLTGSTGRLGGAFLSLWGEDKGIELIAPGRRELDLAEPGGLRSYLEATDFDVLVNPAAVTSLEGCLDEPDIAKRVNAEAPRIMAEVCREKGRKLIHFSTDYVFSGDQPGMKTESEPPGAVNVYGSTKEAGEQAVMNTDETALVCRVSWLFGPVPAGLPSHFDNVLTRALAGETQHLISDKYSMPTFTHDIVGWVELLLERDSSGVYHLCNSGEPESWYSYARKVCTLAGLSAYAEDEGKLVATSIKDAFFFREKRPVHTAMSPARLVKEEVVRPRHWLDAAEVYLKIR